MSEAPPPLPPPTPRAFTPEDMQALSQAARAFKKIRRCVTTANFDGWSVGIFAVVTFVCGISDWPIMLMGAAMIVIAYVEITAAARLRKLDGSVIRRLWINQVALALVLIGYAVSRLWAIAHGPGPFQQEIQQEPMVADIVNQYGTMFNQFLLAIYYGIIAIAILVQGSMALYYHARGRTLREYVQQTPQWICEMQRAGMTLR